MFPTCRPDGTDGPAPRRPSAEIERGLRQRIDPAQAREAREVDVVRVKLGLVFDRDRGQMGVGAQGARNSGVAHQILEDL